MFDLCARDLHHTIEYYILYEQGDHGPAVKRCYPSDLSDVFIERIIEFAFCCDDRRLSVEEFVIVFTDAKGILEFVFCYQPNERFLLCISSKFPWCECFHSLLSILWHHGLYRDVHWSIMEPFFSHLISAIPPRLPIDRIQCANPFNPSMGFVLRIPTPQSPHYLNYVIEYYNALDLSLWIHIFVSLLLERSLLFCSRRLTKLTACVLTSVSLLYPIQWVHSFYPLIPDKVLGVLECPVPFVAGIHSCNLEKAKEHLCAGTRLVDLDLGQIYVHKPTTNDLHTEHMDMELGTPKAIFSFLHHQLKENQRQLNVTMNSKKLKNGDWKQVNGEILRCFERLTHPFFELIVNLLGCYTDCLIRRDANPEVDLNALIACQSCPGLESFLKSMFESQTIQLFLDQRSRRPPDQKIDLFEDRASQLRGQAKNTYHYKATVSFGPIFTSSLSNIASNSTKYDLKLGHKKYNFGSPEWLRAKKLKNPGRICQKGLPESTKRVKSESSFTWNILSRKAEQSLISYKSNKFGSMDINPKHAPIMARMQDIDHSPTRNRPNSCFANSTPSFASGTLLSKKQLFTDYQNNRLEIQTGDSRSSDSSFKSSSSPANRFNPSDMESNKSLKREPPPRPPPPRFIHNNDLIQLKSIHQMKSQTLVNETRQSVLSSKNDSTKSFTKLHRIKSEKDAGVISSVYDETCSLTHARRKTCPSTDGFTASSPPPLPPRPYPPSLDLLRRSTTSLLHLDICSNKSMNGYSHNSNMNLDRPKNGTSLCRPLKIPITTNPSGQRSRHQLTGNSNGIIVPRPPDANVPPPLPPRKLSLKVQSPLSSNSYSLKSISSESNPNLLMTKYKTTDSKLSLCERRAKRFQSLNDKNLQINPIKMTLPLKLTQSDKSIQSGQTDTYKQQTSHQSISQIIDGLPLECQKSNCSTLSQSISDTHSRSGSYYSIVETKTNPLNVPMKNSISELLSANELSLNVQNTNSNNSSSGEHRLLVRLKYGTVSWKEKIKTTSLLYAYLAEFCYFYTINLSVYR
ncbi:unnamed protein product [Schistosoma rodhaini]|uniref:UDENN domain-containing protein n=1 Tax=Schistosoma rodhaini TaxID=6188 RepID=A0AA85FJC9_9TREM|nr:unnamed protein product [Schistosoma rodhaini]